MGPAPAVAAVRRAVRHCIADLDHGGLVLVACSGGADSLALAAATALEGPRGGLRAGAVTVDHRLQDGSAQRARATADQLCGLGLDPVEVVAADVGTDGGPEAAARVARYRALHEVVGRLGAVAVLLGHTLDDQAETVLLGLARGSGARSLAGMPATRGHYRRPLLDLPRATVRAAGADLRHWEDPHNADPSFARSRVRHDVLPVLEKALGPGVPAALARTATQLRADADALDEWATRAYDAASAPDGGLTVGALEQLPAAVRSRVLRRAAIAAGCSPSDLTSAHVGSVDRLVTDWLGQGPLHLPGGVRVSRHCGTLALTQVGR